MSADEFDYYKKESEKISKRHDNCMGKQMCVQLIEQAIEKTRQQCADIYKNKVEYDYPKKEIYRAILNAGKQDKGEG